MNTRILIPTNGPDEWRALLADPTKHCSRTYSAFEIAVSWEAAQRNNKGRGLPHEIAVALDTESLTQNAEVIFALPEHRVTLDTSRGPSQTDVWALLRSEGGLISMAVEGKARESFDKTVEAWLKNDKEQGGRNARLKWLCEKLQANNATDICAPLRYQLFHRTVAALLEAKRCGACAAVMMVQAFPYADKSWADFESFGAYLGCVPKRNQIVRVPTHREPLLFLGWASSSCATDAIVASAML